MKKILVVGAGAAGMMAAVSALEAGAKVILIEKNSVLGKKVRITGKGRCNVTNCCTPQDFVKNVPTNAKFLFSVINQFSPQNTIEFFEKHGTPLKVERGNRVFPCSDKASDIVDTFKKILASSNCTVLNKKVKKLLVENGVCCGVETDAVDAEPVKDDAVDAEATEIPAEEPKKKSAK